MLNSLFKLMAKIEIDFYSSLKIKMGMFKSLPTKRGFKPDNDDDDDDNKNNNQ